MKVKVINRSDVDYGRDRITDLHKVHKNLDPSLHPFEKAVEYTRSLNAVKLDRYMAGMVVYWCLSSANLWHQMILASVYMSAYSLHLKQYLLFPEKYFYWLIFENGCISRVFAKPFVAAFPHDDCVTCLARNPQHLNSLVSARNICATI